VRASSTAGVGASGGYLLAKPPEDVTLADVIRAVEGPLGQRARMSPDAARVRGLRGGLRDVWVALRSSVRAVLEQVTLADVAKGELPPHVAELTRPPTAWLRR